MNGLSDKDIIDVIKIQALFRGVIYRKNNLPNSIKIIKNYLESKHINCSNITDDGRTNSCFDETIILDLLKKSSRFNNRIFYPSSRHWFDIAIKDYRYGWIPINIKSTTTKTSDNTGNMAICMYALTDFDIDLKTKYQNGLMAEKFIDCLKNNRINYNLKRDYYFIVINKESMEIIINSIKGLSMLTPNINNLPFQIKWCENKTFVYNNINNVIKKVKKAITKPNPSWRETFLNEIRQLK